MAGYTPSSRVKGILDPVHARAVLIENEIAGGIKKKTLLISMETSQDSNAIGKLYQTKNSR